MPQNHHRYLQRRTHHKCRSAITIRQDSRPLEDFIRTRQKEKIEIVWILHKSQRYSHCRPTRYHLRQKRRGDRQRRKMHRKKNGIYWKTLHRDLDIGTQPRHLERAGQVITCGATLRSHLIAGLMMMMMMFLQIFFEKKESNGVLMYRV